MAKTRWGRPCPAVYGDPTRRSRCGNAGCRYHADPAQRHGPYPAWTRSVGGKTVTRSLSPPQTQRYQPWFNARRLRELVDELNRLGLRQARLEDQRPTD